MKLFGLWLMPLLVWILFQPGLSQADEQKASVPLAVAQASLPQSDREYSTDSTESAETAADYGDDVTFDIPIVVNERVKYFIEYFSTQKRRPFRNWLSRSTRYIPRMRAILREHGMPEDLVYVAMVESGFNVSAYSRAHACGPWQFIKETGGRYGLKVNKWLDERRNPEKATAAAAKYLKNLYEEFGCWYLAAAGYNAGENKVRRGLKVCQTADYWDMCEDGLFSKETEDYVPQIIAAAIIAKDPEKYGFTDVEYQKPIACAKIAVPPKTDLRALALACGVDYNTVNVLNAELCRGCTPPEGSYKVNIPQDSLDDFRSRFPRVRAIVETKYHQYIVNKGDTLAKVARRFGVSGKALARANSIKGKRLKRGKVLRIPYHETRFVLRPEKSNSSTRLVSVPAHAAERSTAEERHVYTVEKGDTLFSIAGRFGVSVDSLLKRNGLPKDTAILAGSTLVVKTAANADAGVDSEQVRPQTPKVRPYRYYKVRKGDTVWRIAKKYKVVPADIRSWNGMEDNTILPGARLKLKVSSTS